jgi:hypothetical protein
MNPSQKTASVKSETTLKGTKEKTEKMFSLAHNEKNREET